ncbi:hypothetical protein AYI68_g2601 [Smittium mucronatum]|uniref:MULE transposase domain-containing protein n=1 Tax=Smittium mucronatum TaxID=133383 RepID=A0A1R0H285_9FUNG|nr:hypothetical protein AYI68_g2601 [Smittium mucronatum]
MVYLDNTYRLIDVCIPVILVGISDASGIFILTGISVVPEKSSETYLLAHEGLKKEAGRIGVFSKKNPIYNRLFTSYNQRR